MNIRLKKRIFDRLYENLKDAEIIDCMGSIWVVDRDKEYWYLEYQKKSGLLLWRYDFFNEIFLPFSTSDRLFASMVTTGKYEYDQIIVEWVEELLNCKINSTYLKSVDYKSTVKKVLNCKP
jgi:hypothetical protein